MKKVGSLEQGTAGRRSGNKRASSHLKRNFGAGQESRRVKQLSQTEIRILLMGKAKTEILGRLKETENSKSYHMKRVETKDSVTFWTLCNMCRIHFEYRKIYLGQILMCPHCQKPFLATEKPASNVDFLSARVFRREEI